MQDSDIEVQGRGPALDAPQHLIQLFLAAARILSAGQQGGAFPWRRRRHLPLPTSKPTSLQGAQGPTKMPIKISVLATVVRQQARREGSFGSWPAVGQRCLLLVGPLSMRAGLAEQPSAHEDCRTAKCPCSERHQEAVLVGPLPQDAAALQPGGRDHPLAHLARRQHLRTRGRQAQGRVVSVG